MLRPVALLSGALLPCALLLGALTPSGPAAAQEIGMRLMVQPWDPLTDDDTVTLPVDDPRLLSGALAAAWSEMEPNLVAALTAALATPDFLYDEVTLGNIDLRLPAPVLRLRYRSGGGGEPIELDVEASLAGVFVEMTSTTPGPLGSWADPRCSARADLTLGAVLRIGDPATPVQVRLEPDSALVVDDFSWDSQNVPCDVVKELVGLLGAEALIEELVEGPAVSRLMAAAFSGAIESVLGPLNAQVAALIPPDLTMRHGWLASEGNGGQVVALYWGEPAYQPDLGPPATIQGTLRVEAAAGALGFDCARLPLLVDRKAGPTPVVNASGGLGEAPRERLAIAVSCDPPGADGTQAFRVSGLSSGFPNLVTQLGLSGRCPPGVREKAGIVLDTSAWPGVGAILPRHLGAAFDTVARRLNVPCPPEFERPGRGLDGLFVDPLLDPDYATRIEVLDALGVLVETGLLDADSLGVLLDAGLLGALNPQPLPPEPPPEIQVLERQIALQGALIELQRRQIQLQGAQLGGFRFDR